MRDIPQEYLLLFNTLTNTETALSQLCLELIEAQRQAEELYISAEGGTPDDEREVS